MSQSERAEGRSQDLMVAVLGWLKSHDPLTTRLEYVESVENGAGVIAPYQTVDAQRRKSGAVSADVALAVDILTGASERRNLRERRNMVVRVVLEVREGTYDRHGAAWSDGVMDEVRATLTTQHAGWLDTGLDGGQPVRWTEEINRFMGMVESSTSSWG